MSRKKGSRKTRTSGLESDPESPKDPFTVDENFVKLNLKEIVRNLTKKYVTWSPTESAWLRMKDESAAAPVVSLRQGLANALRKSFAGCFIRKMNRSENTTFDITEKKSELTQFMLKMNERPMVYSRLNDYTEDIHKYLLISVRDSYQKNGRISQKMFIGNLPTLRLCFQKITQMDASLRQYKNLLALIITANYIGDFPGRILPPNLNMLELFGNLMFDVVNFAEDAPLLILYLGIGRNYLSNVYSLRLLERFVYLYFLDLSENDFEDLNAILEKIAKLPNLKCLSLEGNPCSVPVSYVHIVQRMCPQVDRLDGIKYIRDLPEEAEKDDYTGVLQIHGIRFFRIPKPTKEASPSYSGQKVDRFYQLEFEIPLLDPALCQYEARAIRRNQLGFPDPEVLDPVPIKGIALLKPRLSVKSTGTKSSIEAVEDVETRKIERSYIRWLNRDKETPTTTTLMSPKAHWAKVMHFPSPAIEIPVNQEMWRQLRDTMRSVITMRLYYKEVTYKKSSRSLVGSKNSTKSTSRRASRSSRRASKRQSKAGGRKSMKRKSKAGGGRQSMKRKSKAGGGRQSMKRKSKAGGGRQSIKRQSKAAGGKRQSKSGGEKRGSIKRKTTGWSGNNRSKGSKGKMEEVLLVRNLIAKIPVPVEMPKWNVHFMGYTWDMKERCWAKKYPGIEKVKYSGSSFKSSSHKASGGPRKSSAGKRQSRASTAGKRKSRASSAGKKKSRASSAGKRKSRASTAGKRKSKAGGQRKSKMGGEKRKSRASKVGSHRKSMGGGKSAGGRMKHSHDANVYPMPKIMTCHVGVGLKREGKEAPPDKSLSGKHSQGPTKSKSSRKSKTGRKSRMGRKSKTGGQRKFMKRASKAGKK